MIKWIVSINKKIYYGWVIVAIGGLAFFMSSPGQTYSISVFVKEYSQVFGYSQTQISTAYSIATILSGLLLIFMGKAIDKNGSRKMMIFAGIMLALSTLFSSFASNITMIFIGFFLLRYFGQGSLTLLPNTLVPQWFEKNRALAISIAAIGGLLGTLLVPSINLYLIKSIGWENAWRIWSAVLLIIFIPLVLGFAEDSPEKIGLKMENQALDENLVANDLSTSNNSYTLKEAIKTKSFWIAGIISTIPSMFTTGMTFHFYTIMELSSITNENAALIIGLIALPSFIVPLFAKPFIDKQPMRRILFITLLMMIISMVLLITIVSNTFFAILFILFYGLSIATQGVALNVLWPNYFGRKHLGSIRGLATVFMVIGSALGPLPFGISYDQTGNYNIAIIGMIILAIISASLALFIRKPHKSYDFS